MSSHAHRLEAVPEPTSLRDQVAACGNQWAAAQHQLVHLVVALDDSGEWQGCGFPTCAHWVASALDIEVSTVREWLRIGRKLSALPAIAAAYATGALSYSKVRSLTRVATADNEVDLCEIARRVPAGRLAHALAAWLARNETPAETEARHLGARRMSWRLEPDGMIVGNFSLPPLAAAPVTAAIDMELVRSRPSHKSAPMRSSA